MGRGGLSDEFLHSKKFLYVVLVISLLVGVTALGGLLYFFTGFGDDAAVGFAFFGGPASSIVSTQSDTDFFADSTGIVSGQTEDLTPGISYDAGLGGYVVDQCGVTLSRSGTYYLDSTVSNCGREAPVLLVSASDVVFDCQHEAGDVLRRETESGGTYNYGVSFVELVDGFQSFTLRNCNVDSYDHLIFSSDELTGSLGDEEIILESVFSRTFYEMINLESVLPLQKIALSSSYIASLNTGLIQLDDSLDLLSILNSRLAFESNLKSGSGGSYWDLYDLVIRGSTLDSSEGGLISTKIKGDLDIGFSELEGYDHLFVCDESLFNSCNINLNTIYLCEDSSYDFKSFTVDSELNFANIYIETLDDFVLSYYDGAYSSDLSTVNSQPPLMRCPSSGAPSSISKDYNDFDFVTLLMSMSQYELSTASDEDSSSTQTIDAPSILDTTTSIIDSTEVDFSADANPVIDTVASSTTIIPTTDVTTTTKVGGGDIVSGILSGSGMGTAICAAPYGDLDVSSVVDSTDLLLMLYALDANADGCGASGDSPCDYSSDDLYICQSGENNVADSSFGISSTCSELSCPEKFGDLDGSGVVDSTDLLLMLYVLDANADGCGASGDSPCDYSSDGLYVCQNGENNILDTGLDSSIICG